MSNATADGRRDPPQPGRTVPSWRDRFVALRHVPAFLHMIWRAHRGYTAAVISLRLARGIVPLAMLWVGKLIIDRVIAVAAGDSADTAALWRYVAIEMVLAVAADLGGRASTLLERVLGDLVSAHVNLRILDHAGTLDLQHFEDSNFHNRLERARQQAGARLIILDQILTVGQDCVTVVTLAGAVLAHSAWLGCILLAAVLPSILGEIHFAAREYALLFRYTPERRLLNYLHAIGTSDRTAKEVQILGLTRWLVRRYRATASRFYREVHCLSTRKAIAAGGLAVLGTAGYYAAYLLIILAALESAISIGQLTFLAGSFARARDLVQRILVTASHLCEQALYLGDLFAFFALRPRILPPPRARRIPTPIRRGFHFEDVGFRYPDADRWVIRNLNLHLRPGECVALVGENGAGKSTLIKLLLRLYDPTEGRITLDGVDLRNYDPRSLRRAVGVVFQDFVRFYMRLDENIGVGDLDRVGGYLDAIANPDTPLPDDAPVPAPIRAAAERSHATRILRRLPGGYRQMLGRLFDGGVDLSGGEWQKVALARAYMRMRDAQVLILDEPTAALDARAEFEIFEQFRRIARGRMAILISHRFATVRMADRIIVIAGGKVLESGTHDELIDGKGLYAELFGMQAAAYR